MKNILLPTDFSENSWNAIKYALHFFKDEPCRFHLFNAYTPVVYDLTYVLITPAQFGIGDTVRFAAEENLTVLKERILSEIGVNENHLFETVARFDTLIEGVKDMIRERHIDLIIMGTKGATGAKEILFGSNTVQVIHQVICPIIAVPSDFVFDHTQNILFPTDLKVAFKTPQFRILKNISSLHSAKINVLHVSTGHFLNDDQEKNKVKLKEIFSRVSYVYHDCEKKDVVDAITEFIETEDINFLVMINNKRSFFETIFFNNTVSQIGLHLDIPFLVIPSQTT